METKGISKLDLKRQNRRQILRVIRENGPTSRVDIAAELALTRAAVTIITNEMISQNVLQELGEAPIDLEHLQKGRRKILIGINSNYKFVLGAMVNEDNVSVGLSTLDGETLDRDFLSIDEETDQQDIISFIATACHRMMQNSSLGPKQVLGLGLGIVPMRWEQMRAEVKDGKLSFSKLRYMMELELNVPVHCANAIGLYALANLDYKIGRRQNQVLLYSGKEYNLAVVTDNELLKDYSLCTDRIERVVINPNGQKLADFPDGSVRAELSTTCIMQRIRSVFNPEKTPVLFELCDGDFAHVNVQKINKAYEQSDAGVTAILEDVLDKLAILVHNLMVTHYADRAVLQNYKLCDKAWAQFKANLVQLAGQEEADRVILSPVDVEKSFLAGCMLTAENMFFYQGGML